VASSIDPITKETKPMMRLKVGVSRKQVTDEEGSVGVTCEIEVEIPGGATDAEVLRIRDHWLGICEATVDDELCRLRDGTAEAVSASSAEPAARPKAAPSHSARPEYRAPAAPRGRGDVSAVNGDGDEGRPPADGRQLLGWAAKQDPDAKGLVISFGKKKGYPSKIVDWDDEQVRAAYRYARGRQER
jgi:hypothetical protein